MALAVSSAVRHTLILGHRRIVDRCDRDGDRGNIAIHLAIIRLEGETVRAIIISGRLVGSTGPRTGQRPVKGP